MPRLVMYVSDPTSSPNRFRQLRRLGQRLTLRPVSPARPMLYKLVRNVHPWMTVTVALLAAAYPGYKAYIVGEAAWLSLTPSLKRLCTRINQTPEGCWEYGESAALLISNLGTIAVWFLLVTAAILLGFVHSELGDHYRVSYLNGAQVFIVLAIIALVSLLAVSYGVMELHIGLPEIPEVIPQPRNWLPTDRRA